MSLICSVQNLLAQANFLLAQLKMHSHCGRASVSFPHCPGGYLKRKQSIPCKCWACGSRPTGVWSIKVRLLTSLLGIFLILQKHLLYPLITFIIDRCPCSLAAGTPVKYEWDSSVLPNHPPYHPRQLKSCLGRVKRLKSYWNFVCYLSKYSQNVCSDECRGKWK